MTSNALLGFLCSFESCLALGTQWGGQHLQLVLPWCRDTPRKSISAVPCQCQSPILPPASLSISQGPSVQMLFLVQPYNAARGFLFVEFVERNQIIHLCLMPFLKVGCGICLVLLGWLKNSFCCSQCLLGCPGRSWVFCGDYYCAAAISQRQSLDLIALLSLWARL